MVFSAADIERFLADGFVMLRRGFSQEVAAAGRVFISELLGLPNDPEVGLGQVDCDAIAARLSAQGIPALTSGQPMVHVQHSFKNEPFVRVMNSRLHAALDELTGTDRWIVHNHTGWWPILFPGFPGPGGWHVDAVHRHHVTSQERGLVTLFLYSDIPPGGGGTALARESHLTVARLLAAAEPDGLGNDELVSALPPPDPKQIVEVTGVAGDVALMHPFLVHGFSPNTGRRARVACTPQYPLKEPMQLDRPAGMYSSVEEAIRRATIETAAIPRRSA